MMLFNILNSIFSALYISNDKDTLQRWTNMFNSPLQPLSEIVVMDSNNTAWVYPLLQTARETIKDT